MVEHFDYLDLESLLAMHCGSLGIRINTDMILNSNESLSWHRYNEE
jgi:hypothetical protein